MTARGLFLRPLDQLFFRDGRAFGESTRVQSGLPNPTTLTGAIRTFFLNLYGADLQRLGQEIRSGSSFDEAARGAGAHEIASLRVRGPWLATRQGQDSATVYFPLPRHLRPVGGGSLAPAQPMGSSLPGWREEDGRVPLWCKNASGAKQANSARLLPSKLLPDVLAGGAIHARDLAAELYSLEERTGIAIDPHKLTASESQIYAVRMLALKRDVGFYCEIHSEHELELPEVALFPFGGESRYVQAEPVAALQWPQPPASERRLLYLTTPAFFSRHPWKPELPPGPVLRAASIGDPFAVSGWDLARGGPKPTRFGVPAGSVYFYEGVQSVPDFLSDPADAAQGYGHILQGVWNYV